MKKLKIAVLWHFHQPYYKINNEFVLPWVRLHGVKDYFDLPELFHEYPNIKQTINLVPSLFKQIEEYVSGNTKDKIQRLTEIPAVDLSIDEKKELLRLFFLCNIDNMIMPYQRYKELYKNSLDADNAINIFDTNDWLDLQVWYNLTWLGGISKNRADVFRLFKKERNFTEEEKLMLLDIHLSILGQIKQQLISLVKLGQLEISCTPMYHPILPLLCDSRSALEAMPNCIMPDEIYNYPQDAIAQVQNAINYFDEYLGIKPNGMWPSEGSISDATLDIIASSGLSWTASDEEVIASTLKAKYNPIDKYFPREFKTKNGSINLLFRDHNLSDAIGFVYSRWNASDAANDFCNRLINIRNSIINQYGEDALDEAVVPVMLDGENCWEFFYENGLPFRRALFEQLSNSELLISVTCSEAIQQKHLINNSSNYVESISHIRAGSWINANFKIWIGHKDDRAAWTMLAKARKEVENLKNTVGIDIYQQAMHHIYIAEGSDWCWWYGDEHVAENKDDFDVMFRWHIEQIYKILGLEVPENVFIPISQNKQLTALSEQHGEVNPIIDGRITSDDEWTNSGIYDASASMSAMHQIGEIIEKLWFAKDKENIFFRIDLIKSLSGNDLIELQFIQPKSFKIIIKANSFEIKSENAFNLSNIQFAKDDIIEISISSNIFKNEQGNSIEMLILTKTNDTEIIYPRQGILSIFNS